jgi:hypothetical protein
MNVSSTTFRGLKINPYFRPTLGSRKQKTLLEDKTNIRS